MSEFAFGSNGDDGGFAPKGSVDWGESDLAAGRIVAAWRSFPTTDRNFLIATLGYFSSCLVSAAMALAFAAESLTVRR